MPQFAFLEGQPFWVVYVTLLVVIMLRAPATHLLGRGVGAGVNRGRLGERLGPKLEAAKARIDHYGAPVVTLSFFTVGMQTAIHFASGAVRMRFPTYIAATFIGGLIWAGLWGTVISGLVGGWLVLFLNSPWTAVGVVVAAIAAVTVLVLRGRRKRNKGERDGGATDDEEKAPAEAS